MNETRDAGALTSAAVLVDVGRELVVATGADRVRFLQGIVTGNVAGTPVGAGCHAALLNTKAHVVAEMWVFARPGELYLAVPRGQAHVTAQALARYAIMDDFAAAPSADFTLVGLLGPSASTALGAVGYAPSGLEQGPLWSHADVGGPAGALWIARARQLGVDGFWIGGPASAVGVTTEALSAAGVPRLAHEAAEMARVAAVEPAWGREITADVFPMEVGLDDAIDYTKGCFLGQEPIVRIRDRGHTNWRLVRLAWGPHDAGGSSGATAEDQRAPAPGDRVETESRPKAGRLTSVALRPDGSGLALALAHVSVASGAQVRICAADGASGGGRLATVGP